MKTRMQQALLAEACCRYVVAAPLLNFLLARPVPLAVVEGRNVPRWLSSFLQAWLLQRASCAARHRVAEKEWCTTFSTSSAPLSP